MPWSFHRFIPVSLGAGQTLVEGIADYDTGKTDSGYQKPDMELIQQEATSKGNPEYAKLVCPTAFERDARG